MIRRLYDRWTITWLVDRVHWVEQLQMAIAWSLPRWLVKWAVVRATAHATMGQWGSTHPDSITPMDVMERWEQPQ